MLFDKPGKYYLGTQKVRKKDGYRIWFGGVEIKKNYVSAHLMAVYGNTALLKKMSPALKKRMQGKTCFNFKKPDTELFKEFASLVKAGAGGFSKMGWLE